MAIMTSEDFKKEKKEEKKEVKKETKPKEKKLIDRYKFPNAPLGKAKAFFDFKKRTYEVELEDGYAKFPKDEKEKNTFRKALESGGFINESIYKDVKKNTKIETAKKKVKLYHPDGTASHRINTEFYYNNKKIVIVEGIVETDDVEIKNYLLGKGYYL